MVCLGGPSSIFIFFPIVALWNSSKCDVIQQIKNLWPYVGRNAVNSILLLQNLIEITLGRFHFIQNEVEETQLLTLELTVALKLFVEVGEENLSFKGLYHWIVEL